MDLENLGESLIFCIVLVLVFDEMDRISFIILN
jgi:hypothetical protein